MEFEKDTPTPDADRRLAETKKLTLEPLHTDIGPDEEPESTVVARHLSEGALANAPNDTEQEQMPVKPSASLLGNEDQPKAVKRGKTIIIVVTVLVVVGIILTAIGLSLQL